LPEKGKPCAKPRPVSGNRYEMRITMKKQLLLIFFTMIFCLSCGQQIDTITLKKEVIVQYKKCLLLKKKKSKEYLKYVHPTILKQTNEKNLYSENLDDIKVINRIIENPKTIFTENNIYQCSFQEKISIDNKNKEDSDFKYSVIAISYDEGKNWCFFNAYDTLENMKKDIPELNEKLEIKLKAKETFQF
jgi:hypothetical protein